VAGTGHQPRFAQLTYASADRAGYARGWQVQDTVGALTSTEQEFLTRRIVTRLTPAANVPAYLAADEVRGLPRRLVYAPAPDGAAAYWHTAPCGSDAQGRPGNVFVHVLLDRAAHRAGPSPARPSDLCRSPHWLRPFGRDDVATTTLDTVPEPPWEPAPGWAEVLAFLFRTPPPDVGVLCLLLDAVYAAMAGGPQVVFGARTEEAALCWIAAASHLMSPGTARRFHWSTSERLVERRSWPDGVHLVVVPYEDVAGARPLEGLVLLGEDERVRRIDRGRGPRVTRGGSSVAVTEWSAMAYEVSALPERAAMVLSRLDRVAAEAGDCDLDPAWPMAMVVATMPDEFPDAVPAARRVLETRSPRHLATDHPGLYAHVLALAGSRVGPTTEDAWNVLLRGAPTWAELAVLRDLYLLRALGDEDWLARRDVPGTHESVLTQEAPVAAAVRERAAELLRSLHRQSQEGGPVSGRVTVAAVVVRFTDIVRACRIDPEQDGGSPTRLNELWDWVANQVVLVPGPRESLLAVLGNRVGPDARTELARVLTRCLGGDRSRVGTRVPVTVLGLVGTRLPRPAELKRMQLNPLQRELAACLTLVDPDPWSLAWLVRVWDLLGPGADDDERDRLLRVGETARPGHLAVLLDHPQPAPVHDLVRRTLLQARPGAETDDLVDAVLGGDPAGAGPAGLRPVAELRRITDRGPETPEGRIQLLTLALRVLTEVTPAAVTPSVWRAMLAAHTAEMLRRSWDQRPETVDEQLPPAVTQALRVQAADPDGNESSARMLARYPDVPDAALVHAGLCLRWRGEDIPPGGNRLRRLGEIVVPDTDFPSIVNRAASLRHRDERLDENGRDDGLRRFRQELPSPERSRAWRLFATRGEDPDAACRAWWAEVTATGPEAATTDSAPWGGY